MLRCGASAVNGCVTTFFQPAAPPGAAQPKPGRGAGSRSPGFTATDRPWRRSARSARYAARRSAVPG
jgi:hypothetical protein